VPTTSESAEMTRERSFRIVHETIYRYEPGVTGLALRLRLFPSRADLQRVRNWTVKVGEDIVKPMVITGFGDAEGLWFASGEAKEIVVRAEGEIDTLASTGVVGKFGRARPGVFLRETKLTAPDEGVIAFSESIEGGTPLSWLHALNAAVSKAIVYRPGATSHGATVGEALALGAGVCHDHAHLFLAAARHHGHPARYVVGYLHDEETPLSETHAWAEAYVEGLGWVGFDPTHSQSPTSAYVRLCSGLDAADAAPLRGTFQGNAEEELEVSVTIATAGLQQQQQ